MVELDENALRNVVACYEASKRAALEARDTSLREFAAAGWSPARLQRITGYARETIRQALNPQARAVINANRREVDAVRAGIRRGFPMPVSLDQLHGPAKGVVTLPRELQDLSDATYDLGRPADAVRMYEAVLHRARSVDDLCAWLDRDLLVTAWPRIFMPHRRRDVWERRFPELSSRGMPLHLILRD